MSKAITRSNGFVSKHTIAELAAGEYVTFHPRKFDAAPLSATLFISPDSTPPRAFTEEQVKAIVEDIKAIAAENAQKAYTNRIEQMTPPAPVAFHIDNYMWKKYGIASNE